MAAAPSIGRATAVEAPPRAREAELTHTLYERHSHQLYGFCFAKLGSREEAEDAVQTTFLNAFRALERGVVPQAESAWLFKIAENVCLSRHRSSFRRRRVESPSDLELLQEVVPAPEHGGDELVGLERVLEKMPESQRRAILLREWQGLSYREIADEMELTQAAVETLIFRARRSLAQGLEALENDNEPLRRRVRRGADAGGLVAALKTFLGTAAGMKAAATVVTVGAATVVAAAPPSVRHHLPGLSAQPAKAGKAPAVPVQRSPAAHVAAVAATRVHTAPKHELRPALLASRAAAAHRAAPAERASAPAALAPAAAAPAVGAAAPQPEPARAAAPQPSTPQPSTPVQPEEQGKKKNVAQQTNPAPVPAGAAPGKDNGKGKGDTTAQPVTPAVAAPADQPRGREKQQSVDRKKDLRLAPVAAATTSTAIPAPVTTTPVPGPTATPATTTTTVAAAAPAPAVTTPAPVQQGHRDRGHGAATTTSS